MKHGDLFLLQGVPQLPVFLSHNYLFFFVFKRTKGETRISGSSIVFSVWDLCMKVWSTSNICNEISGNKNMPSAITSLPLGGVRDGHRELNSHFSMLSTFLCSKLIRWTRWNSRNTRIIWIFEKSRILVQPIRVLTLNLTSIKYSVFKRKMP